jgi:hypothetical protein
MKYDKALLKEAIEIAHGLWWCADTPEVFDAASCYIQHFHGKDNLDDSRLLAQYVTIVCWKTKEYERQYG